MFERGLGPQVGDTLPQVAGDPGELLLRGVGVAEAVGGLAGRLVGVGAGQLRPLGGGLRLGGEVAGAFLPVRKFGAGMVSQQCFVRGQASFEPGDLVLIQGVLLACLVGCLLSGVELVGGLFGAARLVVELGIGGGQGGGLNLGDGALVAAVAAVGVLQQLGFLAGALQFAFEFGDAFHRFGDLGEVLGVEGGQGVGEDLPHPGEGDGFGGAQAAQGAQYGEQRLELNLVERGKQPGADGLAVGALVLGGELGQRAVQGLGVGEHLAVAGGQLPCQGIQAYGFPVVFQGQFAAHPAGGDEECTVQVACGGPQPQAGRQVVDAAVGGIAQAVFEPPDAGPVFPVVEVGVAAGEGSRGFPGHRQGGLGGVGVQQDRDQHGGGEGLA